MVIYVVVSCRLSSHFVSKHLKQSLLIEELRAAPQNVEVDKVVEEVVESEDEYASEEADGGGEDERSRHFGRRDTELKGN